MTDRRKWHERVGKLHQTQVQAMAEPVGKPAIEVWRDQGISLNTVGDALWDEACRCGCGYLNCSKTWACEPEDALTWAPEPGMLVRVKETGARRQVAAVLGDRVALFGSRAVAQIYYARKDLEPWEK